LQSALKRALVALALAAIIFCSFPAVLHQQRSFTFTVVADPSSVLQVYSGIVSLRAVTTTPYCLLALPTASFTADINTNNQPSFTNGTRAQICNYIADHPGVQFRGLCSALGLPIGLAQYHLGVLIKTGLVSFIRDGRYKRFFPSKKFSRKQMLTISLLRHEKARQILETLLHKKQLSHTELACEVSITSQALTWHMKRLEKTEFIMQTNEGLRTIYSLTANSTPMLVQCLALVEEKP
jgi:DNA-binding transcriptional ArsR family regulator